MWTGTGLYIFKQQLHQLPTSIFFFQILPVVVLVSARLLRDHGVGRVGLVCASMKMVGTRPTIRRRFSAAATISTRHHRSSNGRRPFSSKLTARFPPIAEICVTSDTVDSLTAKMQPFYDQQTPVVVRELLHATPKNSKALENFPNWNHWEDRIPVNTDCQVELGGNYSQSQAVDIPFRDFLSYLRFFEERFGRGQSDVEGIEDVSSDDLIYLAQNDLFPEILEDIDLPNPVLELGEGKLYSTMLWIGPFGCVSPLHYDPLDNLLMQFVGTKRVVMCAPNSSVRAGYDGNQNNTSPINPEYDKNLPDNTSFLETTLHSGDGLFLPKKWYHYLRTLETSVSINTWFR